MSLADSLEEMAKVDHRIRECSLATILKQLDNKDRSALIKSLDSGLSLQKIVISLRSNGFFIGRESLSNHRNKKCACYLEKK